MIRRALVMLLLMPLLNGCASQQAANQITADCTGADGRIDATCATRHPSFGKLKQEDQRQAAYVAMLNEQVAAKKLTKAQAEFLNQEHAAKITRDAAAAEAANAAAAQPANNALAATGMTLMAAGQRMTPQQRAAVLSGMPVMPPTYVAPAPNMRTTNCNALGNTLNCTSF